MPRTVLNALIPLMVLSLAADVAAGAGPARTPATAAAAPATVPAPIQSSTAPAPLADGTRVAHWTLGNGLRVVTRHVPGARSTAITLCYRLGSREDPPNHEGLAELASQAAFTGRAGDVPMRSIAELDQLRPGGWSVRIGPHLSLLTEACPKDLMPGVLHQVCQRLKGVAVNDSLLRPARAEVRRRLRENYDTRPEKTLYFLSGEMTAGRSAERAARYGTGEGLEQITAREVAALLHERLVPANTVLCVVGDLEGVNVHALVERELGGAPSGTPATPIVWGRLGSVVASLARPDLTKPIGVLGVIAPALTDTMHAYFTAFTISAAGYLSKMWDRPDPPLTSRFQYSIAADPELVRFYPPVTDSVTPDRAFTGMVDQVSGAIADSSSIRVSAERMVWLTGGPLPEDLLKRALTDATVIHTLATTLAALESFGDDAFWTLYRERLARANLLNLEPFFGWYDDPRHHVMLVLRPSRRP